MLRLDNLSMPLSWDITTLTEAVLRRLRIPADMLQSVTLAKKSVDARDKGDVHFVLSVDVKVKNEDAVLKRLINSAERPKTTRAKKPARDFRSIKTTNSKNSKMTSEKLSEARIELSGVRLRRY